MSRHFNTDLVAFSRMHIQYDAQMFFDIVPIQLRLNQNDEFRRVLSCIDQGLKEALVLHLRNLIRFFYNDSPTSFEFTAADYCAEGKWLEVRPPMARTLGIAQKRAEKMLLPLTLERNSLEGPDKPWDLEGLMAEVKLLLHLFLKTSRSECLDPVFVQEASAVSHQASPQTSEVIPKEADSELASVSHANRSFTLNLGQANPSFTNPPKMQSA